MWFLSMIVYVFADSPLHLIFRVFFFFIVHIWDKSLSCFLFYGWIAFIRSGIISFWSCLLLFIFTIWYLIQLSLWGYTYIRFLFDPLYEEIVTNTSDLMVYMVSHVFIELLLPLSIFVAVMLTLFVDWSWIPISSNERRRGCSLEEFKKHLYEKR